MSSIYETIKNGEMDIDKICQIIVTNPKFYHIFNTGMFSSHCYQCKHCNKDAISPLSLCNIKFEEDFKTKCPYYRENLNNARKILIMWFNEELGS